MGMDMHDPKIVIKKEVIYKTSTKSFKFTSLLAILFIGLKLTHHIAWSWWWVLSPIWLPPVIIIGLFVGIPVFVGGCILLFGAAGLAYEWVRDQFKGGKR